MVWMRFASNDLASFESVRSKWYPETQQHFPGTPFVPVGTKCDLREHASATSVKIKVLLGIYEAALLAKELEVEYCECSGKIEESLKLVFEMAVEKALKRRSNSGCSLL
eukprot:TRINITY_DN333_c0_g1_i1.p2 TRINITY_DN333_c0_g1~~TRINITY_DN333_c0_g1_i1.p2  ORF type:complete len:109 (-),score=26.78 TRINITY_DN333_c0_g1_i1:119-445(-)